MGEPAPPEQAIFELRHELLRATDRAVGAEAELDRQLGETQSLRAELQRLTKVNHQLTTERDALRTRNQALLASRTWRIGSSVVQPAARIVRWCRR